MAKRVKKNTNAYENYKRIFGPKGQPLESEPNEPLRVNVLFTHIQKMMTCDSVVMAETDDSWFNCHKLKLPESCGYQFQMQYGLIGWSMGALLGYAQGANHKLFSPVTALHPLVVVSKCPHTWLYIADGLHKWRRFSFIEDLIKIGKILIS